MTLRPNEPTVTTTLDHLILAVNDAEVSATFYANILGFGHEGQDGPFTVVRVNPDCTLQLAPWGTTGGQHLAFALDLVEFNCTFERVRSSGIPFGDSYHVVGNMLGPGEADGARGLGKAVYFFDPDGHLIEIRHYDG
jgi:catechol 2,3-dioxygenase-like lactoylglutathione lyase family enzyme